MDSAALAVEGPHAAFQHASAAPVLDGRHAAGFGDLGIDPSLGAGG